MTSGLIWKGFKYHDSLLTGLVVSRNLLMVASMLCLLQIKVTPRHTMKWALTRENLSSVVHEQQRHRPASASAQNDQRLCYSLFAKYEGQSKITELVNIFLLGWHF